MISKFRGDYFFLSNMYPCIIEYNSNVFKSSEAAYMSRKNNSKDWLFQCTNTTNPQIIKKASHYIYVLKSWPKIKLTVMEEVLRIKFKIPELAAMLIATGDEELVEGNNWKDQFWGVDSITLEGENHLGSLLMKIRSEL